MREQLIIRAEALALARGGLEGRDRERNLREEHRLLGLVKAFDEGEAVQVPNELSRRATPTAETSSDATITLPAVRQLFGTFAPFDREVVIDNPIEGRFTEVIRPGALRDTIAEQGTRVPLRLSHGSHPYVGHLPVGRITELREDAAAGYFSAKPLEAPYVRELVLPMVVEGLARTSFGFRASGEAGEVWTRRNGMPFRELRAISLAEVTLTDRPAYEGTRVGWRSRPEIARPRRDLEPAPRNDPRAVSSSVDRDMALVRLGIR